MKRTETSEISQKSQKGHKGTVDQKDRNKASPKTGTTSTSKIQKEATVNKNTKKVPTNTVKKTVDKDKALVPVLNTKQKQKQQQNNPKEQNQLALVPTKLQNHPNQQNQQNQIQKNQTMSSKRYEIIFNNYLVHLLNRLHELESLGYPDFKEGLDHCFLKYSKLLDNNRIQEYLSHVNERFQAHIKLIAEQDDFLFSADYNQGDLRLISGLDLYNIWQTLDGVEHSLEFEEDESKREECEKMVEKALNLKKTIWKSLTNLYVSSCLALGKTDDSWAISIMKNLRLAKQLEKEIAEEGDDDEAAGDAGLGGLEFGLPNIADFEKIFNGDNPLSQIINDVRNEIDPEEYMRALNPENKPPLEVIMSLFSGQTQGLQTVATNLGMKFENKMKERGLTENDLKAAADGMKKDLSKIPGIGMLLSQLNTDSLTSNLSNNQSTTNVSDGTQNAGGFQGGFQEGFQEGSQGASDGSQNAFPTQNVFQEAFQDLSQNPNQGPNPFQMPEALQNAFKEIQEKMQNSQNSETMQQDAVPMINNLFSALNANMQQFENGNLHNPEQPNLSPDQDQQNQEPNISDPITQMLESMKKMQLSADVD